MTTSPPSIDTLKRTRPEWMPWLTVIEEAQRECQTSGWEACDFRLSPAKPSAPMLAKAEITVDAEAVRTFWRALLGAAARGGTAQLSSLGIVLNVDVDLLLLFRASLEGLSVRDAASIPTGIDGDAFDAVARLLSMPCLMAAARQLHAAESWNEPYCPICGAWPTFVEVRGIERRRFSLCARCGSSWYARHLQCPYCSNSDHEKLAVLVDEAGVGRGAIQGCLDCHQYVKMLTTLQGCSADRVMIEDLSSLDMDITAVERGFTRPSTLGHALSAHTHWRA